MNRQLKDNSLDPSEPASMRRHVARSLGWATAAAAVAGAAAYLALNGNPFWPPSLEFLQVLAVLLAALAAWLGFLVVSLAGVHDQAIDRLRRKLRAAATTDPLTGLANRGSLDDVLAIEHHRLARYPDSCLSIILLDIDRFHDYNESNGHQAGDEVLKQIADTALARVRRAPDILGRYGDDQLLAVLPATSSGDAVALGDCIRRDVEELALAHPATVGGIVTVSLGVVGEDASNPGSIGSLLGDAARALGEAKANGGNCALSARRTLADD